MVSLGDPPRTTVQYPVKTRLAIVERIFVMDWVILIASGVLEAVWATALGQSNGLKKRVPTIIFAVTAVLSLVGLGIALNTLPTGTAYAVWTATGASLTVAWAMITGAEKASLIKVLLLTGIVVCVVGLKVLA